MFSAIRFARSLRLPVRHAHSAKKPATDVVGNVRPASDNVSTDPAQKLTCDSNKKGNEITFAHMAVLRTTAEDRDNYQILMLRSTEKLREGGGWVLPGGPFWVHRDEQTGEITGDSVELKKLCKPLQLPPLDTVPHMIYAPEHGANNINIIFFVTAHVPVPTSKELEQYRIETEWMPSHKAFHTVFDQWILDKDAFFYRDRVGNLMQIDDAIGKGFVTVSG